MGLTIWIDNIKCVDTEDLLGADDVYYVSMIGCERVPIEDREPVHPMPVRSRSDFMFSTRDRTLRLIDGEVGYLQPGDRALFPNHSIPSHQEGCPSDGYINGPIYFFDLDALLGDLPPDRDQAISGIVVGHVAGAAAVIMGVMIGGMGGVLVGGLLLLASITGGSLIVSRHLSLGLDRDDYLGGFQFSVPVEGPADETISFDLDGSPKGILTEEGQRFGATFGTVKYEVTVRVERG